MNRLQIAWNLFQEFSSVGSVNLKFSFICWCFFASLVLFYNSRSGRWNSYTNKFFFYLQCIIVNVFADYITFNNSILQFSGEIVVPYPIFSRFSRYCQLFLSQWQCHVCYKLPVMIIRLHAPILCMLQFCACIFSLGSIEKFSEHLFLHLQGTNCSGGTAGISLTSLVLYDFLSVLIFNISFIWFLSGFFGFFGVSCASFPSPHVIGHFACKRAFGKVDVMQSVVNIPSGMVFSNEYSGFRRIYSVYCSKQLSFYIM